MIEFKNRNVTYPNRRLLEVQSTVKNENGEIEQLIVDISRSDVEGSVSEVGTALNAETLNEMLKSANNAIAFLFAQYFATANVSVSWTQNENLDPQQADFSIIFDTDLDNRLYGKVTMSHDFLEAVVNNNYSDRIQITITESEDLRNTTGTTTKAYDFYIELYTDSALTQYVTKLKRTVYYTNTSTAPLD